jgi:hypothetical protein
MTVTNRHEKAPAFPVFKEKELTGWGSTRPVGERRKWYMNFD